MTEEDSNVARLREAYRLWHETRGGSVEHWMDLLADDIDFRSLAGGAQPLEFTGGGGSKAEVRAYFEGLARDWDMVHFTVEEFIAQRDRVVMLGRCAFTNRNTGKLVETPKVDIWRFADGKAVSFMEFYDTAGVYDAAG